MIDNLDPDLQILFANEEEDLKNGGFADKVNALADRQKRRRVMIWAVSGTVIFVLGCLVAVALKDQMAALSGGLMTELVPGGGGWMSDFLAPLNSVAGLLALCLLFLQTFLRRIWL